MKRTNNGRLFPVNDALTSKNLQDLSKKLAQPSVNKAAQPTSGQGQPTSTEPNQETPAFPAKGLKG